MALTKAHRGLESWKKKNPWVLVNVQNSQALSGRFPTRDSAEAEAKKRGGVVSVSSESKQVFFSEMPCL